MDKATSSEDALPPATKQDQGSSITALSKSNESITISVNKKNIRSTTLTPEPGTFEQYIKLFSEPVIGEKGGSYFVRGKATKRGDKHLKSADLVILDGDSTIDPSTGDITDGAPAPKLVHDVFKKNDIQHLIYTSHSHVSKGNRYRVLIPAKLKNKRQLIPVVKHLIKLLHDNSVYLNNVKENDTWSQGWYLPRVPEEHKGKFEFYSHDTSTKLDVQGICKNANNSPVITQTKNNIVSLATQPITETTSNKPTINDLCNALSIIPSDDYHMWIDIGFALKEYGQEANCLFHEWSKKSEKYDESECEKVWVNFNPTRTNHKHVFNVAKKYGWVNSNNPDDGVINAMLLPSDLTSITDSAKSIFSVIAKSKDMYIFGGRIVELEFIKKQYSLSQVSPDAFRSRIERYDKNLMVYVQHGNDYALKDKRCSMDKAKALMASDQALELLPTVRVVTSCPVLTTDLKVLSKGYHHDEGILVTQGKHPADIELSFTVKALKGLLVDYDFITPSDEARALSMMILPMMKMGGFITDPCPMDTAEANESQSGKTYRLKVNSAIYNSSPLVVTQKNGGVGSVDESIASALATGRPFVLLDNFRGNFNSPMLEAIITTPECVPVRIPRAAEQIIDASAVSFQLSSNGVDTTPDMANRSCITRIRKRTGKQWEKWDEGDLLAHVKANQHNYLGCVIAVIKEWVNKGKQKTNTTDHDMREWAQTMDWIVQNIFKMPPLLDGHQEIQKQVSNPRFTWMRDVCIQAEHDEILNSDLQASNIAEICEHSDIEYPNKKKYHGESANKYIGVIMGKIFKENDFVIVDNYKINRCEKEVCNKESGRSKLSKIYSIATLHSDTTPCTQCT